MPENINNTSPEAAANNLTSARFIQTGLQLANTTMRGFSLPPPRSLMKFIITPSLWRLPNVTNLTLLERRMKNNLLYFQTNYLIIALAFFAIATIFLMKTLLTGLISAAVIVFGILFFLEHIPLARQIKQNHPSVVVIVGIGIVFVAYHCFRTILLVAIAFTMPVPLFLLHASTRCSDNLVDDTFGGDYFLNTPLGQIMNMVGINPRVTIKE